MSLTKLTIKNTDNGDTYRVLFNPTTYSVEDSNKWQDQEATGRKSELQYTGGERRKLNMELFFDTYEDDRDVRDETGEIAKLMIATVDGGNDGKRPPILEITWGPARDRMTGEFPFKGVLESLKQQFIFFTSDGKPVRAKVNASFKEFMLPSEELRGAPRRGSFPAKIYVVQSGDTVSGIAAKLWKDPTRWRLIARENEIDNPRVMQVGRELVIPAVE